MRDYTATLTYAIVSSEKMELPAKMVRWKSIKDAIDILTFLPKKSGRILLKVILSAQANMNAKETDVSNAIVSKVDVGRGPKIKRSRFTSRARVYGYNKHRSFVRVVLSVK